MVVFKSKPYKELNHKRGLALVSERAVYLVFDALPIQCCGCMVQRRSFFSFNHVCIIVLLHTVKMNIISRDMMTLIDKLTCNREKIHCPVLPIITNICVK